MTNSRMVYPETLLKFDTWDTKELENSNIFDVKQTKITSKVQTVLHFCLE